MLRSRISTVSASMFSSRWPMSAQRGTEEVADLGHVGGPAVPGRVADLPGAVGLLVQARGEHRAVGAGDVEPHVRQVTARAAARVVDAGDDAGHATEALASGAEATEHDGVDVAVLLVHLGDVDADDLGA